MTLDKSILAIIEKKLEDGTVEKIIEDEFAKGVQKAMSNLFGSYGDVTKVIEAKVKEVMVPFVEKYNYQDYIVKLDVVLQEVLKSSALENKKLLENFKKLMIPMEDKDIKLTDLFELWKKYVAENIETDGLEIDYDDTPSYESVDVSFVVEEGENNRSWSNIENSVIFFECEHDESMNFKIPVHRWKDLDKDKWTIDYKVSPDIKSLRNMNEFEVLLLKLVQNYNKIIIDEENDSDSVRPEKEPEPSWG